MRLSASRIRSINRRLARAQGISRPMHSSNHHVSTSGPVRTSAPVNRIATLKIVVVPRNVSS